MPKYRVLARPRGGDRREAWNIYTAKNPQEAIKKAKKNIKSFGKHAPKYVASSFKAVKV